jgi:hypothetical protein
MHFRIRAVVASLVLLNALEGFADNPIVQTNFTADPAPMVYNGKVYLYTSHDDDVTYNNFYTMRDYCCYSSTDMVNWTDHGVVASLANFKWANNANNGAWAPQCVERNGKFYLYVPLNGVGLGVYVSDSPFGPFTDPIGKRLVTNDGWKDIDPTVFVDSDNQAYMYWGGGGNLWYAKLNTDMTSLSGNFSTANPKPTNYTEGPWFYKHENLYYLVYAGMGGGTENIQYATSSSATGPWSSKGTVMNSGTCFTNHPGVCDYKGNSYFFYHNSYLSNQNFKRSVCLEQFTYKSDGSIPLITASKNGPTQIDTLNPYDTVQAETMCYSSGVKTEKCSEGGIDVYNIENNDYIKVKGVGFGSGATKFEARVAPNSSSGKIELRLGSQTGTLIGTCSVDGSGGAWTTKTCTVSGATGVQDLFLKFTGSGNSLFKFNWWKFESATGVEARKNLNSQKTTKLTVVPKDANTMVFSFLSPELTSGKAITMSISDLQGRLITSISSNAQISGTESFSINKKVIRSGMYIIRISSEGKVLYNSSHKL